MRPTVGEWTDRLSRHQPVNDTFKHAEAIGGAERQFAGVFGVGHHAEDAARRVDDAGNVALAAALSVPPLSQ
jgi:hypothetical protein